MRKRTPAEWAALALETAEPYGDCLLATAWKPQPKGYVRVARSTMLHRLVAEVKIGRPLAADVTLDSNRPTSRSQRRAITSSCRFSRPSAPALFRSLNGLVVLL
jgi:hypothetical protein